MGAACLGENDAAPDATSEPTYRLASVEFAGELKMLSKAQLEIRIQGSTCDGGKVLILLIGSVATESDR